MHLCHRYRYFGQECFHPFFSSATETPIEAGYWLVDSGASRTVVSSDALSAYRIIRERCLDNPLSFQTASGDAIHVSREVFIEVYFRTQVDFQTEYEKCKTLRYELRCVVAPVQHNLLSVTQLVGKGAKFEMSGDGTFIILDERKQLICDVWSGVPWLHASLRNKAVDMPADMEIDSEGSQDTMHVDKLSSSLASPTDSIAIKYLPSALKQKPKMHASVLLGEEEFFKALEEEYPPHEEDMEDHPIPADFEDEESSKVEKTPEFPSDLKLLKKREEEELVLHRLRGHTPFDARCMDCKLSRSVMRHPRSKESRSSLLVQADFFFIGDYKFLALSEVMTGLIGCALCAGETNTDIRAFFNQLGLLVMSPSEAHLAVEVRTDAEKAVASILKRANLPVPLHINEAAPQSHQTVGHCERTVRRFKEMISCLQADLRSHGFVLKETKEAYRAVTCYVAQTHNHFGIGSDFGNRRSPIQLVIQRDCTLPTSTMFGAIVFAKVSDHMEGLVEEGSRFVLGAYMHIAFGSFAHEVSVKCKDGTVKQFKTEVRPLNKICWECSYCPDILAKATDDDAPAGELDVKDLQDPVHLHVPVYDRTKLLPPPIAWLRSEGLTKDCKACDAIRTKGTRKGHTHSRGCFRRYTDWVKAQQEKFEGKPEAAKKSSRAELEAKPKDGSVPKMVVPPDAKPFRPSIPVSSPDHPTKGLRYESKRPPGSLQPPTVVERPPETPSMPSVPPPVILPEEDVRMDRDGEDEPEPNRVIDVEMEPAPFPPLRADSEYEPTEPPEDMAVDPEPDDMDIGMFLCPPPEHSGASHGILFPIFVPKGKDLDGVRASKFSLCGTDIFLIEPSQAVSEDGMTNFTVEQAIRGRETELTAMHDLDVGDVLGEEEALALCASRGTQAIPCRWVLTEKESKGELICRARCVAQQIARLEPSAMRLGISSSTPSLESFRIVLTLISVWDLVCESLDISTAFLHSDLPPGVTAVVRLPTDLSMSETMYKPAFLDLRKAMNGLRSAAKAWLLTCSNELKEIGLISSPSEPTILCGQLKESRAFGVILIYVDDLLIGASSKEGIQEIKDTLGSKLKVKSTGVIGNSKTEGGSITFLGRVVRRLPFSSNIQVRVHPSYLETVFQEFDVKPTTIPPDLLIDLGKISKKPDEVEKLSPEGAQRYRRILGRVAWWGQSRPDQGRFISLLAIGQGEPNQHHENALRKYLRFVRAICHSWHVFPTEYVMAVTCPNQEGLLVVSDASWGPNDMEKRKSTTGGAIYWHGCLLKAVSRVQGCVTLSSCEAEVISLCTMVKEAIGIRHLVEFVSRFDRVHDLEEMVNTKANWEFDVVGSSSLDYQPIHVLSDSESCLAVMKNDGLSRRVRHLSLSVCYVQELVNNGVVILNWVGTADCVADLCTKILPKEAHFRRAENLGIVDVDPPEGWQLECSKQASKRKPRVSDPEGSSGSRGERAEHEVQADVSRERTVMFDSESDVPDDDQVGSELASKLELDFAKKLVPVEVLPLEVLPREVLPIEVLPREVLPTEVLPVEVLPVEAAATRCLQSFRKRLIQIASAIHMGQCTHVIVDVCTSGRAGFTQIENKFPKLRVVSITLDTPLSHVCKMTCDWMQQIGNLVTILAWGSPPCTGGSPMLQLCSNGKSLYERHWSEFVPILHDVESVFREGHVRALELSKSCRYWKEQEIELFVERQGLKHEIVVARCAFSTEEVRAKHEYRIMSSHDELANKKMPVCKCFKHAPLNHQDSKSLGLYPYRFALRFARNFMKI